MKNFNKIKYSISFYLFSCIGWIYSYFIFRLYLIFKPCITDNSLYIVTRNFLATPVIILLLGLIVLSVIIGILEYIFSFKIKYSKFTDNKFIFFISIIGIILAIFEFFILISFLSFIFLSV